jgi:group II intron reverse transcriptase/maturase
MYMFAYSNIYSHEGNMTTGTDGNTIDGFSKEQIEKIIEDIKKERYYPKPVRRTYIPKKDGRKRPIGISSFGDKLVQEVIRMILNAIYDPIFSNDSHGFRPNRSCHTALLQIKSECGGTSWVIEGDIEGFFDNVDHDVLLTLLRRKIDDGRFIELIRRFLKSGYMEANWTYKGLAGVPQGGIISPILSNIYLHELDKFMNSLTYKYSSEVARRISNPEYKYLSRQRESLYRKGKAEEAKEILKRMRQMPSQDMLDPHFTRLRYVRYADDFAVFIIGSKRMVMEIRESIRQYLHDNLKLNLNMEKTKVTNLGDESVRFLGYEIVKLRVNTKITKNTLGVKKRSVNGILQLIVPSDVVQKKLKPFVANGKSAHHKARIYEPVLDILNDYNSEIRGLYNYYCLATDVSKKMGRFKFYHYYSMLKTVAAKEKSSVKKVMSKYGIAVRSKEKAGMRKIFGVNYQTQTGIRTMTYFNESLCIRKQPNMDNANGTKNLYIPSGCQLLARLNANECELCGNSNTPIEVHHVRKLKDVKKKYLKKGMYAPRWVLIMAGMNRKTLVLCKECHDSLHAGRL